MYLQRKDSVGCIFRLHPRIKVQTVGEEVNYDDQIKFESVATEGQFLHCSKKTFGDININAFSERYIHVNNYVSVLDIIYRKSVCAGALSDLVPFDVTYEIVRFRLAVF